MSEVAKMIKEQIQNNDLLLYMKGTPQMPQCGFSAQVARCLAECGVEYAFVNILENPEIRATLPGIANWPTFPQLWVKGELIGGCDIITQMHEDGELKPFVNGE